MAATFVVWTIVDGRRCTHRDPTPSRLNGTVDVAPLCVSVTIRDQCPGPTTFSPVSMPSFSPFSFTAIATEARSNTVQRPLASHPWSSMVLIESVDCSQERGHIWPRNSEAVVSQEDQPTRGDRISARYRFVRSISVHGNRKRARKNWGKANFRRIENSDFPRRLGKHRAKVCR